MRTKSPEVLLRNSEMLDSCPRAEVQQSRPAWKVPEGLLWLPSTPIHDPLHSKGDLNCFPWLAGLSGTCPAPSLLSLPPTPPHSNSSHT